MTTANIQIKKILVGRGNTAVASTYDGVRGEIVLDTGLNTLRVYDGTTTGGTLLATNQQVATIANLVANTSITVGNVPPATSTTGTLWYDSEGGRTYIRYANAWVDSSPAVTDISIDDLTANVTQLQTDYTVLIQELGDAFSIVQGNIETLTSNSATLTTNFNAYKTYANANAATVTTRTQTLSSNLGAFQTYANLTFNSLQGRDAIFSANLGAYQTYANANARAIAVSLRNLDANVGRILLYENSTGSGANVTVDDQPPIVSNVGSLWWDTIDGRLYLRYNDTWVDASPNTGSTSDLGKFIFDSEGDSAFISTTDDAGASPDRYDIVLIPGGEGNSSIRVPSQANSLAGHPLIIDATAANSAVVINTENGSWTFGNTGTTTFPDNTIKAPDGSELRLYAESGNNYSVTSQTGPIWEAYVEDEVTGANVAWAWIQATLADGVNSPEVFIENKRGDDGVEVRWTFDASGILSIPGAITLDTNSQSTQINISPNGEGAAYLQIPNTDTADIDNTRLANTLGNVTIETGAGSWTFGNTGNLTLPAGGDILDSTGTSVLGGAASLDKFKVYTGMGTAVLTTTDGADGYGGYDIAITADPGYSQILIPNHANTINGMPLSIRTIEANASVVIETSDGSWTFGNTGTTTIPGNIATSGNVLEIGSNSNPYGSVRINSTNSAWVFTKGNIAEEYGYFTIDSGYESATPGLIVRDSDMVLRVLYSSGNLASTITSTRPDVPTAGTPPTVQISLYDDSSTPTANTWTFGGDGITTLPGKLWARASDSGSIAFTNDGTTERGYLKVDAGYNMTVNAESNFSVKRNGTDRLAITDTTSDFKATTDLRFVSNLAGSNKTWTFAATGILTLPSSSYLETTDANLKVGSQGTVTIRSNAATPEGLKTWTFGTDGNLALPAGGNLVTSTGSLHTISLDLLKSIVASSGSWSEFQANIAAL